MSPNAKAASYPSRSLGADAIFHDKFGESEVVT